MSVYTTQQDARFQSSATACLTVTLLISLPFALAALIFFASIAHGQTVTPTRQAIISLQTHIPVSVTLGTTATLTLKVDNSGSGPAKNVLVSVVTPFELVTFLTEGWDASDGCCAFLFTIPEVPAHGRVELKLNFTTQEVATFRYGSFYICLPEEDIGCLRPEIQIHPPQIPRLMITAFPKGGSNTAFPGQRIEIEITAHNPGPMNALTGTVTVQVIGPALPIRTNAWQTNFSAATAELPAIQVGKSYNTSAGIRVANKALPGQSINVNACLEFPGQQILENTSIYPCTSVFIQIKSTERNNK